jgi:two-component system chemotaxis response regulator CheB
MKTLRVLVVDDSAHNRRSLADLLRNIASVDVIGTAADGEQALRMASELSPDLITLDLEMPRMDGFTFLRLLLANQPTPVIVISSQSAKEKVFRALELGAIDFIAKPESSLRPGEPIAGAMDAIKAQLEPMIEMVRLLAPAKLQMRRRALRSTGDHGVTPSARPPTASNVAHPIVVVAASTGGPSALMELFAGLPEHGAGALIVAQHMPERFTRTFAERLDKQSSFSVREAEHMMEVVPHSALVCPGGRCVELDRRGQRLVTRVVPPTAEDRYAPSADRLFASVARTIGKNAVAVVLTGMGDDSARGVVEIKRAGGMVLAESEETAVVYGMPRMAVQSGCVDERLPLAELVARIRQLVEG